MIFVIVPLGKAASDNLYWLLRIIVYVGSSVVGGAVGGTLAALIGSVVYSLLPGPTHAWPLAVVGVMALLYALHEARLLRLPTPERHWQVPNGWIRRWAVLGTAMFGVILGSGLLTFIPFSSFYVLLAWEAGTGSVLLGAALGATYGLARGLPAAVGGAMMVLGRHPLDFNQWLLRNIGAWHRLTAVVLAGVAGFLILTLLRGL